MAALVFDLDGTLSDPAVGIGRCMNHALRHHGHPAIAEADVPRYIGPPLDESFASNLRRIVWPANALRFTTRPTQAAARTEPLAVS